MDALLFHNPTAGDGEHTRKELLSILHEAGVSADYCSTKGKTFPGRLAERADLFIAAGGDGTVAKILKKMPDRSIPVAILPLGTANNIARSLGIQGSVKALIAGWKGGRKQPFDIGLAAGPWGRKLFVEAVGIGSMTAAMERIDSVQIERADGVKLGRDTFRKVLSDAKPIQVRLSVDGRTSEDELLLVEILNIAYAGPGIALVQDDGLGDRLFDIVTLRPDQRKDMVKWLGASHPKNPAPITLQQGRKINLTWEGAPLRLDDSRPSAAERADKVTIEIEGAPVTILVPNAKKSSKAKQSKPARSA